MAAAAAAKTTTTTTGELSGHAHDARFAKLLTKAFLSTCGWHSRKKKLRKEMHCVACKNDLPFFCARPLGVASRQVEWYCDDTCRAVDWQLQHRRKCHGVKNQTRTLPGITHTHAQPLLFI
jgi:hypothetical protein